MADLAKLVDELSALTVMEAADLSKMLEEKIEKETIDITLPATKIQRGSKHPVNRVIEEIEDLKNDIEETEEQGGKAESTEDTEDTEEGKEPEEMKERISSCLNSPVYFMANDSEKATLDINPSFLLYFTSFEFLFNKCYFNIMT